MKKRLVLAVVMVYVISITILVVHYFTTTEQAPPTVIGEKYPDWMQNMQEVQTQDSATDMLLKGIANYYLAEYVAGVQSGNVVAKVAVEQTQLLSATKIKDGERIYFDTATAKTGGMLDVSALHEAYVEHGKVRARDATGKIRYKDGQIVASSYTPVKTYDSVADYIADGNPNDPEKIFMHKVTAETIAKSSKPIYYETEQCYKYTVSLDTSKAIDDYKQVVLALMGSNASMFDEIIFHQIELSIVQWKNGMIRSIDFKETYELKGRMISGMVDLEAIYYYSYDANELNLDAYAARLK